MGPWCVRLAYTAPLEVHVRSGVVTAVFGSVLSFLVKGKYIPAFTVYAQFLRRIFTINLLLYTMF